MVSINSYVIQFQDSIGMLYLQVSHKSNVNISLVTCRYKARELLLLHRMAKGEKMFILVTKNWGSNA